MSFEEFCENNKELSYLVAKIYYNIQYEKKDIKYVINMLDEPSYGICENCSS